MSVFVRCVASSAAALLAIVAASSDARAASACKLPGFDQAAFGDTKIDMGNGCTDSFDSSIAPGTYAGTKCTPDPAGCVGGVATNGTGSSALTVNSPSGCVKGGCTVGYGGDPSNINNPGQCNGTAVAGSVVELQSVTVPTLTAASPASPDGDIPLTAGLKYDTIDTNAYTLSSGNYVMNVLKLAGTNDKLIVGSVASGPIIVYVTGSIDLTGGGVINTGGKATDLIFMCADTVTDVKLAGGANAAFGLYCPKADIVINGGSTLYGAVVGKSVTFNGSGTMLHYDKALSSFTTNSIECPPNEISRAEPIFASIICGTGQCGSAAAATYDGVFQGTFETITTAQTSITSAASIDTWEFPWIKGHMRGRDPASITTSGTKYSSGTVFFDAATKIPARNLTSCTSFDGSCRHIFTNTNSTPASGSTRFPTITHLNTSDSTADLVGPLIAPAAKVAGLVTADYVKILTKVINGGLGGVDRSTVAVIEESSLAGAPTRPRMVYFGGTDGMLHAVCATVGGSYGSTTNICPAMGTELWAFLPRAQLPLIRTNISRLDGSVHVIDAFGDFNNPQTGRKSWRTILTFQTGYHKASELSFPAAYAIDITNPADPKVLWEYTTPASPSSIDFGTGSDVAAGPTLFNGQRYELAVLETNSNGTSTNPGVATAAIDLALGTRKWLFGYEFTGADNTIPKTGIPGGAVGIDLNETGYYTYYMFADLSGRVWRVDATTGVSVHGATTPLFQFSTQYKPIGGSPALWRITSGGALYVAFASGGFMDQENTAWMLNTQYIVVAKVQPSSTPLNESSPSLSGNVRIAEALGTGYGSYSSPKIIGDQLFVTADSGNINASTYGAAGTSTGKVYTVDLQGVTATTSVVVAGGASTIAAKGTTLYAGGGGKLTQLATAATSVNGQSVDVTSFSKTSRNLWLRTE